MKKTLPYILPLFFLFLTSCFEPTSCAVNTSTGETVGDCARVKVVQKKLEAKSIGGSKTIYDMFGGGVIRSNSSITIYGMTVGDIKIEENAKVIMWGAAESNIENYGDLRIYGSLTGDIINYNKVTIGGSVDGKLYGDGYKYNPGSVINGEAKN